MSQSSIVTDRQILLSPKLWLSTLALPLYQAGTLIGLWLWGHGNRYRIRR